MSDNVRWAGTYLDPVGLWVQKADEKSRINIKELFSPYEDTVSHKT